MQLVVVAVVVDVVVVAAVVAVFAAAVSYMPWSAVSQQKLEDSWLLQARSFW